MGGELATDWQDDDPGVGEGAGEDGPQRSGLPMRRVWAGLAVAALVVAALIIWREPIRGVFADRAELADLIRGAGAWGPLWVIGITFAQVIVAPIPGQAINFVAGYLYGFWLGGLISWLGLLAGSATAMGLARLAGRPLVHRLVSPQALARLDAFAEGQGLRFFFLVFLVPFLPDDLACFLAGLTPLPLPALLAVAAVGRIPGLLVSTWLGANAERLTWQAWLIAGILMALGVGVVWRYGDRLQALLLGRITRR